MLCCLTLSQYIATGRTKILSSVYPVLLQDVYDMLWKLKPSHFIKCFRPPLFLHNSCSWDSIPKEAMDLLNKLHFTFYRILFATPRTTCIPSQLCESGSLTMEMRVNKRKLLFFHHIMNLNNETLAHTIATIQDNLQYPGLIRECRKLLLSFGLLDIDPFKYSKPS